MPLSRVRSKGFREESGFKNTKLEDLGVRTILLIHATPRPHQPQLVSAILGIGKQRPLLSAIVLGIGKQSATTRDHCTWNEVIGSHGA